MHREHFAGGKGDRLNGEIVGADQRDALLRQPYRAAYVDARLGAEISMRVPELGLDPTGADQHGVARAGRNASRRGDGSEVGRRDRRACGERPATMSNEIEQHPACDDRPQLIHAATRMRDYSPGEGDHDRDHS